MMLAFDTYYQNIEWSHDPIDGEPFKHEGSLQTFMIRPTFTIGLSDWWNLTLEQFIGQRKMGWYRDEHSNHHREEVSNIDFKNQAEGGIIGDSKISIKYLLFNEGGGEGVRLYFSSGLTIPSKNQLKISPFLKDSSGNNLEHRHFSISPGVYKINLSMQYYYKRKLNPVFFGTTISVDEPIRDSDYGFSGSRSFNFSFSALFNDKNPLRLPISTNIVVSYNQSAYWNGIISPNSESTIITPGAGIMGKFGKTFYSINIQKPIFLNMFLPESADNNLNNKADAVQISLNFRRMLNIYVPWL